MSTTNVSLSPGGKGKQQKNSNAHIALVMQEVAIKLTRKLTEEESKVAWECAVAADHEVTAEELLKAINEPIPPHPGNGKKKRGKFEVTADLLIRDVGEALGRDLTPAEQGTIQGGVNDLRGDVMTTKPSYSETVRHYAGEFKQEAEQAAKEARIAEEQTNPPLERWTTEASELGTNLKAKIGTFAAMGPQIEQVRENFSSLKDAVEDGRLPKSARIMPTYSWKKTNKDGKTTTAQLGFLDFQDYCKVILKRGKSAVYAMLKDAKAPREPKNPDNSLGALVKRGAKSFINLHKKLEGKDKKIGFDSFMEQVVASARSLVATELATAREEADRQPATTTENAGREEVKREVLPPSQGQAA